MSIRASALGFGTFLVWGLAGVGAGLVLCILGFWGQGLVEGQRLGATAAFFTWPGLGPSVLLTLSSGLVPGIMGLVVTRWFLASLADPRGHNWLTRGVLRLLAPVLAIPHLAFAVGLVFLIWPGGWIGRLLSPWLTGWERVPDWIVVGDPWGLSLMLGLFLRELPFLLFTALSLSRPHQDVETVRQARALGLDPPQAWAKLVWPRLWLGLRMPFVLVLGYGLTNVEMALVLGPNTPPTLSVWILSLFSQPTPQVAAQVPIAALVLSIVTALGILVTVGLFHWQGRLMIGGTWMGRWPRWRCQVARWEGDIARLVLGMTAFVAVFGLVAATLFALSKGWRFPDAFPLFSLATLDRHFAPMAAALGHTLGLGLAASLISLGLVIALLERLALLGHRALPRFVLMALYLPLILPQILVVIALYGQALDLGLRVSWGLVLVGHVVFCLPYTALFLAGSWLGFDRDILRAGQALGLGPVQRLWRLKMPMLLRPLLLAFGFSLSVSIALYLPTLVLGGGRVDTLLTQGVHFASNLRRPAMALYAVGVTVLSFAGLGLALVLPPMIYRNRQGMRE